MEDTKEVEIDPSDWSAIVEAFRQEEERHVIPETAEIPAAVRPGIPKLVTDPAELARRREQLAPMFASMKKIGIPKPRTAY